MSGDKKYYIETVTGKHMLLRISDFSEYTKKEIEYGIIQNMVTLGIPMSLPIDFGVCDKI
jgi:serine/threonine-protein kinase